MTANAPTKYIKAMVGTIAAATVAIRVIPPMITKVRSTDKTLAVIRGSREKVLSSPAAILFIWGRLPVLNTVAMAKMTANHLAFSPFSM